MTVHGLVLHQARTRAGRKILLKAVHSSLYERGGTPLLIQFARRATAAVLCALLIPVSRANLWAQQSAPPPANSSAAAPAQPLASGQLDQLVAPIALYPDALIAQILAASTYPTQIVDADRWMQTHAGITPKQILAGKDVVDPFNLFTIGGLSLSQQPPMRTQLMAQE